jgi:molybdenum cofactor biosynthesis protein B
MSESSRAHQQAAADAARHRSVRCAILTVSDTRTLQDDVGGNMIELFLRGAQYEPADRAIVKDDPAQIRTQLEAWLARHDVDVIITTGGTGIARRDTTVEVVRRLLTAELEGFGELFRMLSWQQVGAAAMLSRAVAGLVSRPANAGADTFIFSMPGSPNAVETAMRHLICPQICHLVWERRR